MKIECNVIEVRDCGDILHVVMQGKGAMDADWRGWERQEIKIACTPANQRAYHVGRKISINVRPA